VGAKARNSSAYLAIGKARRENLDRSRRASGPASLAAEVGEGAGDLAPPGFRKRLGRKQTDPSAQRARPYFYGSLIVYDLRLHFHRMDSDFDPQREAEAVMKLAAAAEGPERQRLLGLAIAWLKLARGRVSFAPRHSRQQPTRRPGHRRL